MVVHHFTLIPGQDKNNYCKLIMELKTRYGNNAFPKEAVFTIWIKTGGLRVEKRTRTGDTRTDRKEFDLELCQKYWSLLSDNQYIRYLKTIYPDKLHPLIPRDGLKYYILDPLRVTECESTRWYQSKVRKIKYQVKESSINERRCRLLNQLFAQFGSNTPFTYEMIKALPKFYREMADKKDNGLSEESRIYARAAANYMESSKDNLLDVWNSLIRNNYILPYKIKDKHGIVRVRPGAYKLNMDYVKRCLQA